MEFQAYTDEERNKVIDVLKALPLPIKLKVDGIFKDRSLSQNSYYWLTVSKIADHMGLTQREAHHMLLKEFATVREYEEDGDIKCDVESTAMMNTLRMEQYLENIRRWMLTVHGLYLPLPNEYIEDNELKIKTI